jgi:hypothetical protein
MKIWFDFFGINKKMDEFFETSLKNKLFNNEKIKLFICIIDDEFVNERINKLIGVGMDRLLPAGLENGNPSEEQSLKNCISKDAFMFKY